MGWPLGSICAQAAHAAVAAVWEHREHADTVAYCAPDAIDGMHKVVLEVKGETQLVNLAAKLAEAGVDHKRWMEQPENFPTCLATRPYPKAEVAAHFKKCNLAKGVIARPTSAVSRRAVAVCVATDRDYVSTIEGLLPLASTSHWRGADAA